MDHRRPALFALLPLVVATAASCRDVEPLLFPAAQDFQPAPGLEAASGTAGYPVTPAPGVRVLDGFGNPVPGVPVRFVVEDGEGSVSPDSAMTDETGWARADSWVLDQTAGPNALKAEIRGVGDALFEVEGEPGPPAELAAESPEAQEAEVATPVPDLPSVRVQDEFGNPIVAAEVAFEPEEGSGTVTGSPAPTDEDGVARLESWTLGTAAGLQTVTARVLGEEGEAVGPLVFQVQALPGPPEAMEAASAQSQPGEAGSEVLDPPAVLVTDEHENPVPDVVVLFQVVEGEGSIEGSPALTDEEGTAAVESWTLGLEPGPNRARAFVEDLPELGEVFFEAEGLPPTAFLTVTSVHLNQGSQSEDGGVGGVAGRPAFLRVVAEANEENDFQVDLLLRLFVNGSLVREEVLPPPADSVPVAPDLDRLEHTWNLPLAASEVEAGLEVEVILDPDSVLPVLDRDGHHYPAGGGAASLDVEPIPTFRLIFFPIHWTTEDLTGEIHEGNLTEFLEPTRQWIATEEITTEIRGPLSTDRDLTEWEGWTGLLSDLQGIRTAEDATDEYYHGIVPDFQGIPFGGVAYRTLSPSSTARSGLTYDRLPFAAGTLAHELGHNLGRMHAPCGGPNNVDPDFPYPDGGIGVPGWDILEGGLRLPGDFADYMSYCWPRWTSDYTYGGILEWRRADPLAEHGAGTARHASAGAGRGGASSAGLLVWGRITSAGAVLEPAFALEARPALPERSGPHELRGTAADGRELFRLSFEGVPVEDGPDPDERHFAFFVPLDPAELETLTRIELSGPGVTAERVSAARAAAPPGDPAAAAFPDPAVALDPVGVVGTRVRWNAESYPRVLVRDRETGRILGMGRTGELRLSDPGVPPERLQVLVSDGAATRVVGGGR